MPCIRETIYTLEFNTVHCSFAHTCEPHVCDTFKTAYFMLAANKPSLQKVEDISSFCHFNDQPSLVVIKMRIFF